MRPGNMRERASGCLVPTLARVLLRALSSRNSAALHSSRNREDTMPKVFVHGNPETSALWRVMFEELAARGIDDVTALSPPGFGAMQ